MITDIKFFKEVLNSKMSYIIELKGGIYGIPSDDIFKNLDLSCYEVIWEEFILMMKTYSIIK